MVPGTKFWQKNSTSKGAYVTKSLPLSRTIAWDFFQREYFGEMVKTVYAFSKIVFRF